MPCHARWECRQAGGFLSRNSDSSHLAFLNKHLMLKYLTDIIWGRTSEVHRWNNRMIWIQSWKLLVSYFGRYCHPIKQSEDCLEWIVSTRDSLLKRMQSIKLNKQQKKSDMLCGESTWCRRENVSSTTAAPPSFLIFPKHLLDFCRVGRVC